MVEGDERVGDNGDVEFLGRREHLLRFGFDRPRADLNLDSSDRVYRMAFSQTLRAALRHPDVIEEALFNETFQDVNGGLDGIRVVHTSTFEQI